MSTDFLVAMMRKVRADLQAEMDTRIGRLSDATAQYRIQDLEEPAGWAVLADLYVAEAKVAVAGKPKASTVCAIVRSADVAQYAQDQCGDAPVLELVDQANPDMPTHRERWAAACRFAFLNLAETQLRDLLTKGGHFGVTRPSATVVRLEVASGRVIYAGGPLGVNPEDGKVYPHQEGYSFIGTAAENLTGGRIRSAGETNGKVALWRNDRRRPR